MKKTLVSTAVRNIVRYNLKHRQTDNQINILLLLHLFSFLLDLGGFSIDESGRITVDSASALFGNPPQPQNFPQQPGHDVHVPNAHHQLPESPVAQPVIPHVS